MQVLYFENNNIKSTYKMDGIRSSESERDLGVMVTQ